MTRRSNWARSWRISQDLVLSGDIEGLKDWGAGCHVPTGQGPLIIRHNINSTSVASSSLMKRSKIRHSGAAGHSPSEQVVREDLTQRGGIV